MTNSYGGGIEQMLAILGGFAAFAILLSLALAVLIIASYWKIFNKANEDGWKAIIPIYNAYMVFKIAWETKFFWIQIAMEILTGFLNGIAASAGVPLLSVLSSLLGIASFVINIILMVKLANAFGRSGGFAVGLIFLPVIFIPVLAFGSSRYVRYDAAMPHLSYGASYDPNFQNPNFQDSNFPNDQQNF